MKKVYSFILLITISSLIVTGISPAQDTKPPIALYQYSSSIEINKAFEHKIEARLPSTVTSAEFIMLKGPEGMLVNKEKGIVTWTPTKTGTYIAEIAINSQNVKIGSAVLKLLVFDFLGSISGTISNEEAKLLAGATVIVYKKFSNTEKGDFFSPLYKTITDQNGAYTFARIEAGTYLISAELRYDKNEPTATYLPVWYVDATTMEKATPVVISQTVSKVEVNIKLHKIVKVPEKPVVITYSNFFTLMVGETFNYQVSEKLRAPAIQNANYALGKFPDGMTIDAATGKVTWTPANAGEYAAEIIIKSGMSVVAVEVLKLKVVNFYGVVGGVVKDEAGTPLPNILITLNKKITATQKDAYTSVLSALTKADGSYLIEKVEGGEYFVYARQALERSNIKPTTLYQSVWYVDALTIDKATAVKVADKNKVTVDFTLKKFAVVTPVVASVSGKVTDDQLNPIANAYVIVTGVAKGVSGSMQPSNSMQYESYNASSYGVFGNVAFKTITDKDGNYKVLLPINNSYIFSSFAEGYNLQYYKETGNVLDAKKIELKRDTTGIDFRLIALPAAKGSIAGKVVNAANAAVASKVVLFALRMDSQNNVIAKASAVRSTNTDSNGEFVFEKVANGSYFIQVIPLKEFMPAFYNSKECGVKEFKFAEQIVVKNDEAVKGLVVCVREVRTNGGGKISGRIKESNGNPIDGVIVYAESQSGDVCSFAVSETGGTYEIADLGAGVYNVSAEKPGFNSVSTTNAVIDYAKSSFNVSVDLTMPKNSTTDVDNQTEIPTGYSLSQNYPNPFNPETTISYKIQAASQVSLKVYDVLGRIVATLVDEFKQPGNYKAIFNVETLHATSLPSGIYLYRLNAGSFYEIKKMMLLK
ncbi:MAG: hypothetical protein A2X62_12595 [Stygiobacter sp. GWC2_38_9]|nr:MAG: hypothetical protein A2X62_12595 [Stygiobacter sp. GWC2_38_9]